MPEVTNTFDSDEQLANINCDLSGPESTTLYAGDYSETANGDGTYTYEVSQVVNSEGDYTFTLNRAADADGNNGANGETATVSVSDSGGSTTMIESFEDLSAWSGDLSAYSSASEPPPRDGNAVLRHVGNGRNQYTIETTEYNVNSGNTYVYWGRASYLGGEQWVTIGYDPASGDGLTCAWDFTNDQLELWDYDGGAYSTQYDTAAWTASEVTWFRFVIDFEDSSSGTITYSVDTGEGTETLALVSVSTTKYTNNTGLLITMEAATDVWVSMDPFRRL